MLVRNIDIIIENNRIKTTSKIRIYTDKLVNEKPTAESFADKIGRTKPAVGGGDITQIYTASIQAQQVDR